MCKTVNLLLILLSVMTWTVESKNSVSGDGEWPYTLQVAYENTYQKGDVRDGDFAILTLANLGGIKVNGIDVFVKSNKSGGAGEFTVTANEKTIASLSGSFKDWTGTFDNSEYHSIPLLQSAQNGVYNLSVSLKGTENSLHIEKYVITYEPLPAYTVTLVNGNQIYDAITESAGGQGILLPVLPDWDKWRFVGWSKTEFWTIYEMPELFYSGNTYIPDKDETLWAVYVFEPDNKLYVTDLESGEYIYTNRVSNMALTGVPQSGIMNFAPVDIDDFNQIYFVEFAAQDTAYITHLATGTPIGYSGTQMAAKTSPWLVYHNGEETIFYTVVNNKKYVLWLNIMNGEGSNVHAGLVQASTLSSPMALRYPRQGADEPAFTCHPECGMGIDTPEYETQERIVQFGIYELHIQNGHKKLIIR